MMFGEEGERFQRNLATFFSGYRAEWLGPEIFRLFTRPSYFPQLTTTHPCFLVGGRGTGKTTTLRSLSFQGQAALRGSQPSFSDPSSWPFVGMYYRVNTNRVRAFGGSEVGDGSWLRLFGHYLNLEFSGLVLGFLQWYTELYPSAQQISEAALARFGASIHLDHCAGLSPTIEALEMSRIRFEAMINNVADDDLPALSLQGAPIDQLVTEVKRLPQFGRTAFFFLVDEYENLDGLQQRIVNTLIKHCGDLYSFKVGVREFGDSERSTLNDSEKLRHPADYKRIDISSALKGRFSEFAARVCDRRMKSVVKSSSSQHDQSTYDIRHFLPALTPEKEASLLGVDDVLKERIEAIRRDLSTEQRSWLNRAGKLELYVLLLRSEAEGVSPGSKIQNAIKNRAKWRRQYDNYKYAYLFAIRQGRPGVRKYHAGWKQYCQLASSNIRFLLELVDQALTLHAQAVDNPLEPITPEIQTTAAQNTGLKNLRELEGLSLSGAKLSRFLLGIGRVFQVMAEDPVGHTAEVSQFHLANDVLIGEHREFVTNLLRDGVMHLALMWYPASKLQDRTDIRQFDYSIHPIFAPVLGFGFRRKRKMRLADDDVEGLVERPSGTIARLLRKQRRRPHGGLPEQTKLFAEFYER